MIRLTVKELRKMSGQTMVHGLTAKYHVSGDWLCWTRWPFAISRDEAIASMLRERSRGSCAPKCLRWSCTKLEERELEPLPECGDHMTLDEFVACCECDGFIDYDGYGHYASKDRMTRIVINPSDVKRGKIDRTYTHVVWFNR